jgi:L-alanine-DL-glutamate epimerase-like enolase superfamily enzyme
MALWDLKGKVLGTPVSVLFGAARAETPVYGSGGFTSYSERRLTEQLGCWVHDMKIPRVKMKVGRDPSADPKRVAAARKAIGSDAQLFVDANGAYTQKQALEMAAHFAESNVSWFEEPVYHNDFEGNRFVREHAPPVMEISNGEYGYAPYDFARIIALGAADVLQADVTRCGGYSGFLAVDALCEAHHVPLSSHCAPYVTLPVASAAKMLRHIEYFYDHVRIERMLFDGTRDPKDGTLVPDLDRPGIGLDFKKRDAQQYAI